MIKSCLRYIAFVFVLLSAPITFVSAHVKWFAHEQGYVEPYHVSDLPVILSIIAGIIIVAIGVILDRRLSIPQWLKRLLERIAPAVLSVASIGFGLAFIIFSYLGFVFAPNLVAQGSIGTLLIVIQAIAGAMIFFGWYERVGGLLLVVLFGLGTKIFGFHEMMDTFEMLGFALYAMIIGRPKWKIAESTFMCTHMHKIHQYGVSLLRVGTGINLIILGFSEKILAPALTQDFLLKYDWNFMHAWGFTWFTDYWFAYAAGFGEMMFGVFLLLGLVTRLTIVGLAVFLVTTLILLGPIELVGHLPHFSIAAVLLIFGAGSRLHHRRVA
ncbi:MAG: hypothetical protein RLY57_121 [Candidatus Parcubacteria bacterium]